ncbi:universal stress protein [Halobacterium yunchengense]|uniref:universal stress protein n=1 Tax=Halobacterium yunchengense TaxID=3108497 RepID=UPI00300B98C4
MVSQVLVGMDDSEMAERALEYALEVHPDAEITVLHVVGGGSPMMGEATSVALSEDSEAAAEEHGREVFEFADELAAEHGRSVETTVAFGKAAQAILEHAEEYDVVVIGAHSGSLAERLFTGNTAETVVRKSPVPVTTVR